MATYILVHGGGMGGWVWKYIADPLRSAGHIVHTPTLTGFGDRHHLISCDIDTAVHATDIARMMECEEVRDAVLVVHSYAGAVAPLLLTMAGDRIRRVIYLDAIVPMAGESVAEAMGFLSADAVVGLRAQHAAGQGPLGAGVPDQVRKMADIEPQRMSADRDAWVFRHLTDMPLSANICAIPVGADAITHRVDYLGVPHTMMHPMHARADALGWTVHQLGGDRDHMVHVGDPDAVLTYLIE